VNLEAIALRRSEEQAQTFRWFAPDPGERVTEGGGSGWRKGVVSCECGKCHKCSNRELMRKRRAEGAKWQALPRGPRMILGRVCGHEYADGGKCSRRISDANRTGLCDAHRRQEWDRINRSRAKDTKRGI
jgi:hypothetical protein